LRTLTHSTPWSWEADTAAALNDTNVPGIRTLTDNAVEAEWTAAEAVNAIKIVSAGMSQFF